MAHHKSTIKRMRQNPVHRLRNRSARATFRTSLKKALATLENGDAQAAEQEVRAALKVIGKTRKKGLIHRNKAARHASKLARKLNALKGQGASESASSE